MAYILQEHYNTGDDGAYDVSNTVWWAQAFTPANAHTIVLVKIKIYRSGTPGTITCRIRATDGASKPTGATLASGTVDGDTITTSTSGEWITFDLGAGAALSAGTKYCMQFFAAAGTVFWRRDSAGSYTGGAAVRSGDSGSSWTVFAAIDAMFEEYSGTAPPTVSTESLSSDDRGGGISAVGNIGSKGGYTVTLRGVTYNTTGNPDPTTDPVVQEAGDFDTGDFTESITGLTPETLYYVKAYAYSVQEGYGLGSQLTLTTLPAESVKGSTDSRWAGKAADTTFALMYGGGGGVAVQDPASSPANLSGVDDSQTASPWLFRTYMFFDLSSYRKGISGVSLWLWSYDLGADFEKLIVTEGKQDNPVTIGGSWTQQNSVTTNLGEIGIASITTGGYVKIPLNAAGLALVRGAKGGTLKLCLRTQDDVNNDFSVVVHDGYWHFYLPQEPGKEPYLEFTLSPGFNNLADLLVKDNFI